MCAFLQSDMAAERVIKPEEGQKLAKVREPYSTSKC